MEGLILIQQRSKGTVRAEIDSRTHPGAAENGDLRRYRGFFGSLKEHPERILDHASEADATSLGPSLGFRQEMVIDRHRGAHDVHFIASRASRNPSSSGRSAYPRRSTHHIDMGKRSHSSSSPAGA